MAELSRERLAPVNGVEIAYQEVGDPGAEPLMLVMGLGTQMLGWDERFCALLAGRGFRVVRFDNRDIGHSTMLDSAGVPSRLDLFLGRRESAAYLLSDMAADTIGLMDHLGIEAAHVAGVSMGGMIGQTLAIEHGERVRSLVSVMSTTGSRRVGTPSLKAFGLMLAEAPRDRDGYVERILKTFEVIGSPSHPTDRERLRQVAGEMFDRSHNPRGILRQMHAITASGDRTAALRNLRLPVSVIHGTRDPLIRPSGGRATARAIPGARLRIVEGMGHDLPRDLWPIFADEIADTASRAGWRPRAHQLA
ncbi:MAG TPA: alpha/beta fold hydrolase [Solirubrobacterales bacterium]|jgi:pimeloyl-ACP methyl ester carboxylesterase|nr:alpha/beta fold hydrolase [Solirubrobacterales bacterium]